MKHQKPERKKTEFHIFFALLRKTKGQNTKSGKVSLQQISDATGISAPYLYSIGAKEVTPSEEVIKKLAKYFDKPVDDFYLKLNILPSDEYKAALKLRKKITKKEYLELVKDTPDGYSITERKEGKISQQEN